MAADGFQWGAAEGPASAEHDQEAVRMEQTLLAALLCNPTCFEHLPAGFGVHHFGAEGHGDIFEAAKAAAASGAKNITPAVQTALPRFAGPGGYIVSLVSGLMSARPNDAVLYAREVMEAADRRSLLALADSIRRMAVEEEPRRQPPTAIVNKAIEELDRIAAGQRHGRAATLLAQAMDEAIRAGEEAAARGGALSGLSSGFRCIDDRLGGMEGGGVYVLGARPGVGKSGLALQIAMRVAQKGNPVLFISLEMQARQFGRRALALASGVSLQALKRGDFARDTAMADAVVRGRRRYEALPLAIEDEPSLTVPAIALRAKTARRRLGGLRLVIIDHLHIVGRPESAGRFGDTQAITEISMGIKRMAKDFDIPVLLLAQLNRGVEGREDKRPGLADLRQSGAIEQDAEVVMFLYRPDYYTATKVVERRDNESAEAYAKRCQMHDDYIRETAGKAEVLFDKVRDGERGVETLGFDGEHVRFYEEGER
ncbi:MAG: replicative DNA helicase [Geminicoccaceae bacterium]